VNVKLRVLGQSVTLTVDQHYAGTRLDDGAYTGRVIRRAIEPGLRCEKR
jgi:hypothetical protein